MKHTHFLFIFFAGFAILKHNPSIAQQTYSIGLQLNPVINYSTGSVVMVFTMVA
jgi:hypothetical protein